LTHYNKLPCITNLSALNSIYSKIYNTNKLFKIDVHIWHGVTLDISNNKSRRGAQFLAVHITSDNMLLSAYLLINSGIYIKYLN